MKIIAYSKVPAAVPFVHLGYLSASTTINKPIPGLLFGGVVLLVAGISLSGKWLWQRGKSAELRTMERSSRQRHILIGCTLLLFATITLSSAYVFGEREIYYAHPREATLDHIWTIEARITKLKEPGNNDGEVIALPAQEGEYDVRAAVGIPANFRRLYEKRRICFDAWSMPLRLLVARDDGGLRYAVVSAGPDRIIGTADDITSARARDN